MRQIKRFVFVVMLSGLINFVVSLVSAHSTETFNLPCPEKYLAKVSAITEEGGGPAFSRIEVNFQILQTLKGEKAFSKKIKVIKDGPINFKNGEVYNLELNQSWLCSASLASKF